MDTSVVGVVDLYGVKDFTDVSGSFAKLQEDMEEFKKFIDVIFGKDVYVHEDEAKEFNPFDILDHEDFIRNPPPPLFIVRKWLH